MLRKTTLSCITFRPKSYIGIFGVGVPFSHWFSLIIINLISVPKVYLCNLQPLLPKSCLQQNFFTFKETETMFDQITLTLLQPIHFFDLLFSSFFNFICFIQISFYVNTFLFERDWPIPIAFAMSYFSSPIVLFFKDEQSMHVHVLACTAVK